MNRALLEQPFESAQIRQRKGRNGVLDYVEGHTVIARLNAALDGAWSFEVTHHEVREDEVVVLGRLSADGITKMQFGVSQLTREKGTGALVSLGDDLKAAATDALKKCATFLGVGLHLYADKPLAGRAAALRAGGSPRPPAPPGTPPVRPASSTPPPSSSNGHGGSTNGAVVDQGVTPRQLDAIGKVARAKGLAPAALDALSLKLCNRKPDALTREQASTLIKELSNMTRTVAP
jgi:hypothetical protein